MLNMIIIITGSYLAILHVAVIAYIIRGVPLNAKNRELSIRRRKAAAITVAAFRFPPHISTYPPKDNHILIMNVFLYRGMGMNELLQIVLINLVVSCDNIGVLALATKNLSPEKALTARRLGIGLSLILKILFVAIIGFLFSIPWLHIRIVGGILLIYVTMNMLSQHTQEPMAKKLDEKEAKDSFFLAIISIIAADVSMSLDNVIAVLGVVSSEGQALGFREIALVVLGLLICVPILLWFSGAVSHLMERFHISTYLCAGYLIYTAVKMIFEDETVMLFFEHIGFTFTIPAAVLCGIFIVAYGLLPRSGITKIKLGSLFTIFCIIIVYSFITVGAVSYLNTMPMVEGHALSVEMFYGFQPSGVNAVFTIATASDELIICAVMFAGLVAQNQKKTFYLRTLLLNLKGMAAFIFTLLIICTTGFAFSFGFGSMKILQYLATLAFQVILLFTYSAAICMLSVLIRNRTAFTIIGMTCVILEQFISTVIFHHSRWHYLGGLFPSYHLAALQGEAPMISELIPIMISFIYIGLSILIGTSARKHTRI